MEFVEGIFIHCRIASGGVSGIPVDRGGSKEESFSSGQPSRSARDWEIFNDRNI